jgi:opacity protein-like surface antigen
MASKFLWTVVVLVSLAVSAAAAAQQPNYQPSPNYQQPPNYQPPPTPNGQAPPPNYQQPAPNAGQPPPGSRPPPGSQPPPGQWQTLVWYQRPELKYHALRMQIEAGYTLTSGSTQQTLDNGGHAGLGFTWFPSASLPLGLRVDGSYSQFDETHRSVNAATEATGLNIVFGHQALYGGDADAEIDLRMGPSAKEYFVGGYSWYRAQTTFREATGQEGEVCFFAGCEPVEFAVVSTAVRTTTPWLNGWNAGMGFEFALADPASFFIEARYMRIGTGNNREMFIPLTVGLRF